MRKVLWQLDDQDVAWLVGHGSQRKITAGTAIIHQGEQIAWLYIILDGRMSVTIDKIGRVAEIGTGEVIGELSFVDHAAASATVTAESDCLLFALDKAALEANLIEDTGFAARFYRAIALFLAGRLRGTMQRMGFGEGAAIDDSSATAIAEAAGAVDERLNRLLRVLKGN